MDLNDLPESIQHTVAFAENMTGDQQTNRSTLTVQLPVRVFSKHKRKSYPGITIPTTPIVDANTSAQFEVMCYAEWLTAEAKRNNNDSHQEESRKYADMPSPAFTSTKGVLPLLPAPRASSASTAETGELESMVTVPLAAFTSAGRLSVRHPKGPALQQWLKDPG